MPGHRGFPLGPIKRRLEALPSEGASPGTEDCRTISCAKLNTLCAARKPDRRIYPKSICKNLPPSWDASRSSDLPHYNESLGVQVAGIVFSFAANLKSAHRNSKEMSWLRAAPLLDDRNEIVQAVQVRRSPSLSTVRHVVS